MVQLVAELCQTLFHFEEGMQTTDKRQMLPPALSGSKPLPKSDFKEKSANYYPAMCQ